MARPLPVRRTSTQVRRRPVRRASARYRPAQVAAALVAIACLVGIVAVAAAPPFAIRILELHGARFTAESAVRAAAGLDGAPNAFGLHTDDVAARLAELPAVRSARVSVRLPGTLVVDLEERTPRIVWAVGDRRYAADQDGVLFGLVDAAGRPVASASGPVASPRPSQSAVPTASAVPAASAATTASPSPAPPSASSSAALGKPKATRSPSGGPSAGASAEPSSSPAPASVATPLPPPSLAPPPTAAPSPHSGQSLGLPVVYDRRAEDAHLVLGSTVDFLSLDAGFRIASLRPGDVGSGASRLVVVLDDTHGFTLSTEPASWVAEFGFYTGARRRDDVVPNQVRDLRSLLGKVGEDHVAWVWLVADVAEDHVNSYLPR